MGRLIAPPLHATLSVGRLATWLGVGKDPYAPYSDFGPGTPADPGSDLLDLCLFALRGELG